MQPLDAVPPPSPDSPGSPQGAPEPAPSARAVTPGRRPVLMAMAIALAAAVASWAGGEVLRGPYKDALSAYPENASNEEMGRITARRLEHSAGTYGLFGAVLGGALGVAGGRSRRSVGRSALAGVVGLIAGGAAGTAVCMAVLPIHNRHFDGADSLMLALLTHAAIFMAVGAAAGLAFGVGAGGFVRSVQGLLGGLLGAAAATMLFEVAGALIFPLAGTSQPISATWATRLLAQVMLSVLAAAGAASCTRAAAEAPEPTPGPG